MNYSKFFIFFVLFLIQSLFILQRLHNMFIQLLLIILVGTDDVTFLCLQNVTTLKTYHEFKSNFNFTVFYSHLTMFMKI